MLTNVFVYGSLKRNGYNHRVLNGSTFAGNACTVGRFVLCDGAFPKMAALQDCPPGMRSRWRAFAGNVYGEVYAVDDATLADLDRLEGTPTHYRRESLAVRFTPNRQVMAEGYLYANPERLPTQHLLVPNFNDVLCWPMPEGRQRVRR